MSQQARMARLLNGSLAEQRDQWRIPLITAQVVDLTDPIAFPEIHLAREHARRLREQEARNG